MQITELENRPQSPGNLHEGNKKIYSISSERPIVKMTGCFTVIRHWTTLQICSLAFTLCTKAFVPVSRRRRCIFVRVHSMAKSPPDDPVFASDLFFLLSIREWRNHIATFESFEHNIILGPTEVYQAVSSIVTLGTGRSAYAVDIGSQHSVGKFDHCIAKIDDCVAREWLDITPLRVSAWREDLKTAKPVEEDCDTAKVCVLAQRGASVVGGLRRRFDKSDLIATSTPQSVQTGQGLGR